MSDDTGSSVSRRRVLGGSVSLGVLAALAGCIDDDDPLDGDGGTDDADAEPADEPDDPPAAVADGFDLDAALDATLDALDAESFAISAFLTDTTASNGDASVRRSQALETHGDPADEAARYRLGRDSDRDLADGDLEAAGELTDVLVRDGTLTNRFIPPGGDEPEYDRGPFEYGELTDAIGGFVRDYHEVGTEFEFDDPEWDADEGVYRVESTSVPDEEIESIEACTLHVDPDGVVVGLEVDLRGSTDERIRTEATGEFGVPVTVDDPDWLDEAEAELDDDGGGENGSGY